MVRYARAFAPGHVTGVFRPASCGRDPRRTGSVGAGLVLELGSVASVSWDPSGRRSTRVTGSRGEPLPITAEAVEHLRSTRPGKLRVEVTAALPVGQGFGMSAAGTLAASLATASLLGLPRSRAIETAHLAELFGRGGLGGVAAILGGGLDLRRSPGVPPFGVVRHFPWGPQPVFVTRVGPPILSPRILGDPAWLARIDRASEGLDSLLARPSKQEFLRLSEQFTDRLRLGPPSFLRTARALRRTGCWVAQAMFGSALFIVPRNPAARSAVVRALTSRGLAALEVRVRSQGARRLAPRPPAPARTLPQRL